MDPTFRHSMRLYLESLDIDHAPAPAGDSCACGDAMVEGRDRHLLEVITAAFTEPETKPHVIHVKPTFVDEDVSEHKIVKGAVHVVEKKERVRRQVVNDCPDCGRGLTSRGHDMICPTLPITIELKGCHEGCVVACGVIRG